MTSILSDLVEDLLARNRLTTMRYTPFLSRRRDC
jgi:hypothetical protein